MRGKKGSFLITMGLLLIAAALFLSAYNLWEEQRAEESVVQAMTHLDEVIVPVEPKFQFHDWVSDGAVLTWESELEVPDYILNPQMDMPEETIDGWDYIGILEIPALELELPIITQWSYPALKVAPARYAGSAYLDNLVIAAHNYTAHFGRIQELSEGDRLIFTDIDGNVFVYEAAVLETLKPTAIEQMCSEEWALTLFTCTLDGKSRVTLRCDRVTE